MRRRRWRPGSNNAFGWSGAKAKAIVFLLLARNAHVVYDLSEYPRPRARGRGDVAAQGDRASGDPRLLSGCRPRANETFWAALFADGPKADSATYASWQRRGRKLVSSASRHFQ
mmetsp:Transcript_29467/g.90174  ORF Transcript_29467/g.90174 Transcript_29467/m.90174 type:complete len:114 (-) Transcript_29467:607-948(-)